MKTRLFPNRTATAGTLWKRIAELLLPRRCRICGCRLDVQEETVCAKCFVALPFTGWRGRRGNPAERLFWGKIPVVCANAYLHYHPGSDTSRVVLALKYRGRTDVGRHFGRIMAKELCATDFFEGIDLIAPVPLAPERERQRGYNQSECIARGVAEATGLAVCTDAVVRTVDNPTQTSMSRQQRAENVRDIFLLRRPERLRGKHILLIDDVLTTGATLLSCTEEMVRAGDVRISILSLFIAGRHSEGPLLKAKSAER